MTIQKTGGGNAKALRFNTANKAKVNTDAKAGDVAQVDTKAQLTQNQVAQDGFQQRTDGAKPEVPTAAMGCACDRHCNRRPLR